MLMSILNIVLILQIGLLQFAVDHSSSCPIKAMMLVEAGGSEYSCLVPRHQVTIKKVWLEFVTLHIL
jgi:hypothetical protein